MPEGPNHIEHVSKVGQKQDRLRRDLFSIYVDSLYMLFSPSDLIFRVCVIPWPGPGLCNDGGLLKPCSEGRRRTGPPSASELRCGRGSGATEAGRRRAYDYELSRPPPRTPETLQNHGF